MTLEAWVRPSALGNKLADRDDEGARRQPHLLRSLRARRRRRAWRPCVTGGECGTASGDQHVNGVAPLPLNTWTHIATTYDGASTSASSSAACRWRAARRPARCWSAISRLRIGGNDAFRTVATVPGGEFFVGLIDDVRVYNRALTAAEITFDITGVVAASPPPPPPPPPGPTGGLVLSLTFDEASGDAIDASSSHRNGVVTGATRVTGKSGRALQFDGVDDWVTVADGAAGTPLDLTTGMTIEAWVKPSAMNGWETVVLKEAGANLMSHGRYAHDGAPLAGGATGPAGYARIGTVDQKVSRVGALSTTDWTHLGGHLRRRDAASLRERRAGGQSRADRQHRRQQSTAADRRQMPRSPVSSSRDSSTK